MNCCVFIFCLVAAGNDLGHLRFPYHYRTPIRLAEPVSLITPDLFRPKEFYPNLPSERN